VIALSSRPAATRDKKRKGQEAALPFNVSKKTAETAPVTFLGGSYVPSKKKKKKFRCSSSSSLLELPGKKKKGSRDAVRVVYPHAGKRK